MKIILYIAKWEFITRFKTKSFLFSTFILPLVFALMITLPAYFLTYDEQVSTKLIGLINLSNKIAVYSEKTDQKEFSANLIYLIIGAEQPMHFKFFITKETLQQLLQK